MSGPKQNTTWDDVLKLNQIIGGEITHLEKNVTFRGPLRSIEKKEGLVVFVSPWCAQEDGDGKFTNHPSNTCYSIDERVVPKKNSDGYVFFDPSPNRSFTLSPKGTNRVKAEKVLGLPAPWLRLLAQYPELPLKHKIIRDIMVTCGWETPLGLFNRNPPATLREILAAFRFDMSAEIFLWVYIEKMLGKKDMHKDIY